MKIVTIQDLQKECDVLYSCGNKVKKAIIILEDMGIKTSQRTIRRHIHKINNLRLIPSQLKDILKTEEQKEAFLLSRLPERYVKVENDEEEFFESSPEDKNLYDMSEEERNDFLHDRGQYGKGRYNTETQYDAGTGPDTEHKTRKVSDRLNDEEKNNDEWFNKFVENVNETTLNAIKEAQEDNKPDLTIEEVEELMKEDDNLGFSEAVAKALHVEVEPVITPPVISPDADCGIYSIKNKITGRLYVGKSTEIARRWRTHFCKLSRGTHSNKYLQHSFNKYGADAFSFEIIEELPKDSELLMKRERHHINSNRKLSYNDPVINKSHPEDGVLPTTTTGVSNNNDTIVIEKNGMKITISFGK